jgi:hypothetical protein
MAAPWMDLTGSPHARTIIAKMNNVNKIETFVRTNFFDPSERLTKNSGKTTLIEFRNICLDGDQNVNELKSNLDAKSLLL